jgi:LPS-assembly lipoprotein
MWWSKRVLLVLPLMGAIAACGFQPVYGPAGAGRALLNGVTITAPATRDGFILRRRLEERLGRSATDQFNLTLTISTTQEGLGVDEQGNTTRYNLLGTADFTLSDQASGDIISSGQVSSFTGYSASGTTVATLAAQKDAQDRLMMILADQILTRLLIE